MKTSMAIKAIKNMAFSLVVLIPLQFNMGALPTNSIEAIEPNTQTTDEVPPSASPRVVLLDLEEEYCDIECFLSEHKSTIEFMSKTFKINYDAIIENIIEENKDVEYDEYNIGNMKTKNGEAKHYGSFEEGLIEYLFALSKKKPSLTTTKRTPYKGDAEYVVDLIKYFTNIYDNVDYTTAAAIGAAESGYYQVRYMLECNNVFGGMGSNGLLKYKTIEYGTLSYIRMLSKNYYGKGLTTIESIGRVYCPTYDAHGNKIASPHWINLVKKAKPKYTSDEEVITADVLLNI